MRHNHIAVWVTVILNVALGFLWYAPFSFLEPWAYGFGTDTAAMGQPNPMAFIVVIIGAIFACYVTSWLITRMEIFGIRGGLKLGLLLWLGFGFPTIAPHYLFAQVGQSALIIDLGFVLIATVLTALILTLWRRRA